MGRTRPSAGRERVLVAMPRMEPTFHCDLARRCWRLGRSSCTRIAALTRQMTVATYPAPIADLRDVRLLKASFFTARDASSPVHEPIIVGPDLGSARVAMVCGLQ
jgi:hypothetical protein